MDGIAKLLDELSTLRDGIKDGDLYKQLDTFTKQCNDILERAREESQKLAKDRKKEQEILQNMASKLDVYSDIFQRFRTGKRHDS